jgi:lysophospholipase L1-like esterase
MSRVKGRLQMKHRADVFPGKALKLLTLVLLAAALLVGVASGDPSRMQANWVGTWSAAPQPPLPGPLDDYHGQSLRLIVHGSAGGSQVRIRLSNLYGDTALTIGAAHIALRASRADIDPASDRALTFGGRASVTVPAHATVQSDPVRLAIPALADVAVSLYLPKGAAATTVHVLAMQTSYVSHAGDDTAAAHFPVARTIDMWPFLTGVDVLTAPPTYAVTAFGDSTVDGDGSTVDANQRWPDALAARLQRAGRQVAVLNAGLIGNRLLHGSPGGQFGTALGEAGVERFSRDVLGQVGVKVVIVRIGNNDIGFLHALAPPSESLSADDMITGYRRLIALAHQHGLGIIGTTIPPFENVTVIPGYSTPAKNALRQQINTWIRQGGGFDAVLDVDQILRDPSHPSRLLPAYDSGDHLHPNDAGYRAIASALSLETLDKLSARSAHAMQ